MIAARRIRRTAATGEVLQGGARQGVRYIYTRLPRLPASSAKAYLANARRRGWS